MVCFGRCEDGLVAVVVQIHDEALHLQKLVDFSELAHQSESLPRDLYIFLILQKLPIACQHIFLLVDFGDRNAHLLFGSIYAHAELPARIDLAGSLVHLFVDLVAALEFLLHLY